MPAQVNTFDNKKDDTLLKKAAEISIDAIARRIKDKKDKSQEEEKKDG